MVDNNYAAQTSATAEQRFNDNLELVSRIAHHVVVRLPVGAQMEDFIQVGLIGLWEASKRYNPAEAASFSTFAGIYIRGAILDELRRLNWCPRSVQAKSRKIAEAIANAEARHGRAASPAEIAEAMGETLEDYNGMLLETAGVGLMPLEEASSAEPAMIEHSEPGLEVEESALRKVLAATIDSLPEREKLVVSLYYNDELNLREIGEVLGVGESRVCQIHSQAVGRIRSRMQANWDAGS